MKVWISAALAAGLMITVAGTAQASPLGSAARDIGVPADSDVIQVQQVQTMGGNNNKAARSGGGGNRQAGSGGAGNRQGGGGGNRQAVGGGGNRNWSGNRGGGNRVGGGGGGRTAAGVAIGLGLVGGLIAAEQQRQAVEQEYVEEPVMMRCPYGSYINRYGERRCRR